MAGKKKLIIEPPAPAQKEISPQEESSDSKNRNDGFGLIQAIYDFLTPRDLIAFGLIKKCKSVLDLGKIPDQIIYYPILAICLLVNLLFSLAIDLLIVTMFFAIAASFVRGLGIVDWIISFWK